MTNTTEVTRAKNLLNRDLMISVGDIVTIDDDSDIAEAYVVKKIDDKMATICGIKLTEEKDDVYIEEMNICLRSLLYLGDSFVNLNGLLWKIKGQIDKGRIPSLTFV